MPELRLKELRINKGMTQQKLAEVSGVSLNNIARLESGSLKNPTVATITKLAHALECAIEDLFFEKSV